MQKKLQEQNQKIVGILETYKDAQHKHYVNGLCYYFAHPFFEFVYEDSYDFFGLFVDYYLVDEQGYCKERQILVDMIIDLILEFNPTLKRNKDGDLTLSCRKKGFKEAFNMIRYYGGYR